MDKKVAELQEHPCIVRFVIVSPVLGPSTVVLAELASTQQLITRTIGAVHMQQISLKKSSASHQCTNLVAVGVEALGKVSRAAASGEDGHAADHRQSVKWSKYY